MADILPTTQQPAQQLQQDAYAHPMAALFTLLFKVRRPPGSAGLPFAACWTCIPAAVAAVQRCAMASCVPACASAPLHPAPPCSSADHAPPQLCAGRGDLHLHLLRLVPH